MQKLKKLSVRLHGGIEVGTLEETSTGKMRFKYKDKNIKNVQKYI